MGTLASISQSLVHNAAETMGCQTRNVYQAMNFHLKTQEEKEARDLGIPTFQEWKSSLPLQSRTDLDLADAYRVIQEKAKLKLKKITTRNRSPQSSS
jgi:hypothetical protein